MLQREIEGLVTKFVNLLKLAAEDLPVSKLTLELVLFIFFAINSASVIFSEVASASDSLAWLDAA